MSRDMKFDLIYKGEHQYHHKKYHLSELMAGIKKICDIHDMMELIATRQYTGLKDKNGVEIYEGDICIPDYDDPYLQLPLIIKFIGGAFCLSDGCGFYDGIHSLKEVIGNIYENPELLEKEQ